MNQTQMKAYAKTGLVALVALALFNRFAPAKVKRVVNG